MSQPPKIKFIPERKYVINPHPERASTLGLAVFFGVSGEDREPSVGMVPEGDDQRGFHLSRAAALDLAQLIQFEMGKPEHDFALAYTHEMPDLEEISAAVADSAPLAKDSGEQASD